MNTAFKNHSRLKIEIWINAKEGAEMIQDGLEKHERLGAHGLIWNLSSKF
jgi:hypothetical protein